MKGTCPYHIHCVLSCGHRLSFMCSNSFNQSSVDPLGLSAINYWKLWKRRKPAKRFSMKLLYITHGNRSLPFSSDNDFKCFPLKAVSLFAILSTTMPCRPPHATQTRITVWAIMEVEPHLHASLHCVYKSPIFVGLIRDNDYRMVYSFGFTAGWWQKSCFL